VKVQRATGALAPQVPKEALPRLICDVVVGASVTRAGASAPMTRAAMPVVAALVRAAGPSMADAVCDAVAPAGTRALLAHLDDMVLTARLERTYAFRLKRSDDPEVAAWGAVRAEAKAEAVVLEDESAHELLAAPDAAIVDVAEDPLHKSVSGLAEVLLARASMPTSPLVCAAALCLADPLHQSAAVFQRAVDEQPAFLARIDAALLAPKVREDLPLLATAWLHAVPQHALRFEQAARHMTLATLLELALELPAPLVSIKMAQAAVATARTWALQRRVWLDRQADQKLAQRVFSLIVRAARPRPPEAGTSTVDAWMPMRLAAVELLLIAHRAGGACKSFVDDVTAQVKALNPILEPPIVAALAPVVAVRSTESEPAPAPAPAPAPGMRDSDVVEKEFALAIEARDLPKALALACEETTAWLVPEHVAHLNALVDGRTLALALASSPHPAAHTKSVYALDALLRANPDDGEARDGLLTFLRAGDDRARELRLFACESLARVGVHVPFVWLRTGLLDIKESDEQRVYWFDHMPYVDTATWQRVVAAALVAGSEIDELVLPLVRAAWLDDDALAILARHLLMSPDLEDEDARMLFLWVRRARRYDDERVRDLKDAVRWGIRQARILLGKPVGVELVHNAWGYTMLSTPRVYVNPLPILRDERGGVDVVKGLLVHEIGHHLYHADPESRAVWDTAHKAQLGSLLNLVADEHLERNLRSVSPVYGDALKTLCSHAFQHANHDVVLELLLDVLGARAFEVLTQIEMRPGKRYGSVNIDVGHLLAQSAGSGGSFARFVRALRQGLGVRDSTSDEKVKEALALFNKKTFRGSTMTQMFEIAKELRRIFGDEVKMLNAVGMHEVMESEESDVLAEGVSPEELKEMDRRYKHGPARGRPVFNKGTDEAFETIDEIVVLAHEPLQHNALAMQSRKASAVLRRALLDLGVRVVIERRRVSGRSIDRAGLANAVAKLDPRILTKRTITPAPDLFIGVVVDCSGSMQRQGSMERGRLFATLIAEAARGVPGVDVRLLGFTDSVIYDAGDEERCAAHAFEADGGNNDAAGLWHAAMLAKQSKRRARLLVMVSDGLPTECTMGALRSLVNRLERAGNCCAQVAVQQLAEHAFRHYVEILDDDIDAAARKFSRVVTKLVKSVVR
jgi:hypothetical protein